MLQRIPLNMFWWTSYLSCIVILAFGCSTTKCILKCKGTARDTHHPHHVLIDFIIRFYHHCALKAEIEHALKFSYPVDYTLDSIIHFRNIGMPKNSVFPLKKESNCRRRWRREDYSCFTMVNNMFRLLIELKLGSITKEIQAHLLWEEKKKNRQWKYSATQIWLIKVNLSSL